MGKINEKISDEMIRAMKAKDEVRLGTFRMVLAEFHNAKIDKKAELDEEEELAVIRKEANKRKDAINEYKKAKREDRVKEEEAELVILQEFLPKDLSEEELVKIVSDSIDKTSAKTMADIGKVMGMAMKEVAGRADGNRVTAIVREKLG